MTSPAETGKEPGVPASEFEDGDELDPEEFEDDGAPEDEL